jgi:hypothetical protein
MIRLRLREEVDILQHLSKVNNGHRHPNVLGFIDSWEEGDRLFIRTELCELGNLARFLWEYGRAFPRLDEARVWKIIADLSNVSNSSFFGTIRPNAIGPSFHSRRWSNTSGFQARKHFHDCRWPLQDWRLWNGIAVAKTVCRVGRFRTGR